MPPSFSTRQALHQKKLEVFESLLVLLDMEDVINIMVATFDDEYLHEIAEGLMGYAGASGKARPPARSQEADELMKTVRQACGRP